MAQNGASTLANGNRKPANNGRSDGFPLPGIDQNELRARIYAKPQLKPNPRALRFSGPTPVQLKKNVPTAPRLEPLPNLARYQEKQRNLPYISPAGKTKPPTPPSSSEPEKKKTCRRDVVEPLEHTTSPLPNLPDELRSKQEKIDSVAQVNAVSPQHQMSPKQKITQFQEPIVNSSVAAQKTDVIPDGLRDPLQIIHLIKENSKLGFLYMTPAVDRSSILYNPYNLKIVKHSEINHSNYYTISSEGVTHMRDNEAEFTALERWEKEYKDYKHLVKIPTFANFRMWKAFVVWRKNVKTKKITQCKNQLQENLFIVNASLRPALLNVREMCYRISDMGLCRVEKGHTYTLDEFRNAQFEQLEEVAGRLAEFRDLVKEVVRSACRTALLEAGFTPDDYFMDMDSPMGMYADEYGGAQSLSSYLMPSGYEMDMYGDAPDKMTYTEQANKRSHCKRLTSFIRLADYLIVNTMHVLAANSVATLLNYLEEQLQHTPTPAQIQGTSEEKEDSEETPEGEGIEQKDEQGELHPLYTTELLLEPQALLFFPGLEDFQEGLGEVIKKFQDAVLSVQNLVPDPYFDAFTQPFINGKVEEKTAGDGPSLATMFEDDRHLQGIIQKIKDAISFAFDSAWMYANTFEPYRQFYQENESLDLEAIRQEEHGTVTMASIGGRMSRYIQGGTQLLQGLIGLAERTINK